MANIVIRSDEANAAATALTLAARNHSVCLLTLALAPGEHDFSYFGERRTLPLRRVEELDPSAPRVGIVFAEGEDIKAGIRSVVGSTSPDLLVIIGGGITAAVESTEAAQSLGFDVCRILLAGAFLVGGNASAVRSEKQGVLAGFLAPGTPAPVVELAESTFPQISIGDAFSVALSSVNALFHLPPMILNAMSVERADDVRFYVEGFGDSVSRLLLELDADRLRLGAALGRVLVPIEELNDRYSGDADKHGTTLREKVNSPLSTQSIKLPSSFHHRFLAHELRSTFAPMSELADALGVDVPTIRSVVRLGEILLGSELGPEARAAAGKFLGLIDAKADSAR
ncbi:NAD/NADP octopine/nopaline dehydrogenase family protein [Arthrobacter ramosus]|uniref:NAD/NADP octopine/nopaline dehydrogenase family protein n=1 Tax=Arthrobacter ramosus TaxID=1672 RepID=A0ABV5XXY1_ARTRM|nr:NAD/NADP octopine/nopaline dehydrogenase family protein [Arthrobacter ramosus]